MTRDFASKSKKRSNATRFKENHSEQTNGFKTIIMGLGLGIVIALTAVYFYQADPKPVAQPTVTEEPAKPSAKNRYKAIPAEEVEQSDFSFHQELPNKTVEVDIQPLPERAQSDKTYIMQCGSFRENSRADNQKAKIALIGYEARILPSTSKNGDIWYRVVIGPYTSKRQADRDRHELQNNGINLCQIW